MAGRVSKLCQLFFAGGWYFGLGGKFNTTNINKIIMSLSNREIEPGIVSFLDPKLLIQDQRIARPEGMLPFRKGPFLCVQVQDEYSSWLNLTSKRDRLGLRLAIRKMWRRDGDARWHDGEQYVYDVRQVFSGPSIAFVDSAQREFPFEPYKRPYVSEEGIIAVNYEFIKYNIPTLDELPYPLVPSHDATAGTD